MRSILLVLIVAGVLFTAVSFLDQTKSSREDLFSFSLLARAATAASSRLKDIQLAILILSDRRPTSSIYRLWARKTFLFPFFHPRWNSNLPVFQSKPGYKPLKLKPLGLRMKTWLNLGEVSSYVYRLITNSPLVCHRNQGGKLCLDLGLPFHVCGAGHC